MGQVKSGRFNKLKCAAAAIALAVAGITGSQALALQPSFEFQQDGGSLGDALTGYARVTRRQLLYSSAIVQGRRAPALRGRYSADEALRRLLAGTGITVRQAGSAYVLAAPSIQPVAQPRPQRPRPAPSRPAREPAQPSATPPMAASPVEAPPIVVTGSNIRGQTEGPSPVQLIGRREIERAGHGSVSEAIVALPQNFGGTGTEDTVLTSSDRATLNSGLGSSANLRGLGSDATLTLVNGRRVAGSGGKGDFTDLSLIPLAAVDRIEVLTDGASAIYGADAVGGVVNIILRDNYRGGETRVRLGTVTQGATQEIQLGQVIGARWSTGSILAAYEFQERDALQAADRRFARTADLRPFGGSDYRGFFSNPGTILAPGATGALEPRYAIPANQNGTGLRPADFRLGANLTSAIDGTDLLPHQTRHAAYLSARQQAGDAVELFAEGRYGRRTFRFHSPAATAALQLTAANPYFVSPDGAPFAIIAYSFIDELGPVDNVGRVEAWTTTGGARAELGGGWSADAYVGYAEERTRLDTTNLVNSAFLAEAAGMAPDDPATAFSTSRDGFFNPYGDGVINSPAILDFVGQGYSQDRLRSALLSANLVASGTLLELPGGPARIALGAAYRRETFVRRGVNHLFAALPTPGTPVDGERNVRAFFAEATFPLFGPANARPGLQRLELSAAVRHERYSDFGASTNPRFGLIWEPATGFRVRGSFGTSFRSPALREVSDPTFVSAAQLRDASGAPNIVLFLTGGNPDLEPERARSWTLGAQLLPRAVAGLRAEANFFQTRFTNRIGQPAFEEVQLALRDAALSPFVEPISPATNPADRARVVELLNTPGTTIPGFLTPELFRFIIDGRYVNTSQVVVRGLDILVSQSFGLFGGDASLALNASYLLDYKRQSTPAAALVDRVDTVGNPPDLRARLSANWDRGSWGAGMTVNHVDGYFDNVSLPVRPIDSWTTIDAQVRFSPQWPGWLGGFSFALSVQNLFDSDPPFVNRSTGQAYDSTNADPLGRFVALQIIKSW